MSDDIIDVDIKEFEIENIPLSCTWMIIAPPATGKTTLIENIAYYNKHRYPVARAFIGTDNNYRRFCDIFHPLYVNNYYSEEDEKRYILRQRTCELENGHDSQGNYGINIVDDCTDDSKIFRSKVFQGIYKLGSQHWNNLFLLGAQFSLETPPAIRKSVSYVALGREPDELERKKLYNSYGGICGSYEKFSDLMDQICSDYTFLIIKKRSQTNELTDCVSWYKTRPLKDWKFGCKEYRKWADERYDRSYIDKAEF